MTTAKRLPYALRLNNALHELLKELAKGKEFPDLDWKIADKHRVYRDDLVDAYDNRRFR